MLFQLPILLLLILLNGLFAMAELALIGARRTRLQSAAANGDRGAQTALALLHESGRLLSTVSIGITVISIVVSTVGGDSFVKPLQDRLDALPLIAPYAHALSIGIVVVVNAFLALVIGELVPKRIALGQPELIASRLAGFMSVLSRVIRPAEWLLSRTTDLVLSALPIPKAGREPVSDEEITMMLREGTAVGAFEPAESAIVQMAFRLADRRADAIMTPRTRIEMLDLEDGWEVNRELIARSSYSRFPVINGGADNVLGILEIKDLAKATLLGADATDIAKLIRPPTYVPNTVPALKLLETFKKSGEPLALVVDEYGDLDGVVTMHDILTALVGDIASPGEEQDSGIARRDDGSWLVAGLTPIDEYKDAVGLDYLPDEDTGDFHTLGGFVMAQMKRVPSVADHVDVDDWRYEVVDMDGHRIHKVLVVPPTDEAGAESI